MSLAKAHETPLATFFIEAIKNTTQGSSLRYDAALRMVATDYHADCCLISTTILSHKVYVLEN
jgi:hypothetical protein